MRIKDPIGISLVVVSLILFIIPWLPGASLFGNSGERSMVVVTLAILCFLSLLILIIQRGWRGMWLLIGLIPSAYWPAQFLLFFFHFSVLCRFFLAPNPQCDL